MGSMVASIVLVIFMASPLLSCPGTFLGLDGSPAVLDHGWNGLNGLGYTIGDLLCHQECDRSFIVNGNQMPICIRDTGLLVGLVIGLMVCIVLDDRLCSRRFAFTGAVMIAVTGVEWMLESVFGDMPLPRFVSGIVAGAGAALILCWLLYKKDEATGRQDA